MDMTLKNPAWSIARLGDGKTPRNAEIIGNTVRLFVTVWTRYGGWAYMAYDYNNDRRLRSKVIRSWRITDVRSV